MNRTYSINLNKTTAIATKALMDLDDSFINTPHYMGITYFWAYEYRHYMRDLTIAKRKQVHAKLLKFGLDVSGESRSSFPYHTINSGTIGGHHEQNQTTLLSNQRH